MKIGSSTESLPDPTPLLLLVSAIVILLWPETFGTAMLALVGGLCVVPVVYWFVRRPEVAVIALIVASAVPRLYVEIAGLKARPEHIVGGLVLCSLPFILKRRKEPVRWTAVDYLLVAYIGANIFSSVFMSVEPLQTLKWSMQQALAILPYFFLRVLISDRQGFRRAFRVLLIAAAGCAAVALLCFYSNLLLGTEIGVDVEQYKGIPATYGLQYEGNILAAYCGALAVMMMTIYLHKRKRGYLMGYGVLGLAGMIISLSRAAVGATVIGLSFVLLWGLWRKLVTWKIIFKTVAVTLVVAVALLPIILPFYVDRFSTVDVADVSEDPNTALRLVQTASAVDNFLDHPVFGNGTASFQLYFGWEQLGVQDWGDAWISNTEMRVLHDTGIIGFGIFVAFLIGLLRQSWKTLKQELNPELLALLFSAAVYAITFQITEGTLLAFSWIHLGLIGCAVTYLNRKTERERAVSVESAP